MIKALGLIIFLVLIGNIVFLDYILVNDHTKVSNLETNLATFQEKLQNLGVQNTSNLSSNYASPSAQPTPPNSCPQSCLSAINTAIANEKPAIVPKTAPSTAPASQKGEYIIPLGSATIDTIGSWINAYSAQAFVNTANYSSIKAFYFEVVMHIPNATGEMRAKLIDDTTPFSYDGQVLTTTSGTGQLLSAPVPLISGEKTYHVQLYTSISTGVLDSARIRIVTQ